MPLDKTISGLIEAQLPDFINAKYQAGAPSFRRFIELYYEWLETNSPTGINQAGGNTIYHIMNSEKYRDIDSTEDGFLSYFKNELLPYFPERTELQLVKILKGAKEFYLKKGTEESIKWLFRVLFNEEANVFYPKDDVLRASDGKWQLPKSIKVSDSPLVVQTATSTRNYFAANLAISGFHSNNSFQTSAEFANNLRKNSTLIGFASYKIWINSAIDATTLYNSLYNYVTGNNITGTMTDSAGTEFTSFLSAPLISTNRTGYGRKLYQVVEGFYLQNVTSDAKIINYRTNLTKSMIESITNLATNESAEIQHDGLKLFELGNLEVDSLIASNSVFTYSGTSSSLRLPIDAANTPAYVFSFGKEELGTTLLSDSANSVTLANTSYGDDKYLLQYGKKYATENVFTYVRSTGAANIASISFAFKERPRANTELLAKKRINGLVSKATAVVEKVFTKVDEYTKSQYTELFLSEIRGEFVNNELVEIEFTDDNDINRTFTERIFGFVGSIVVDPNRKGLNYKVNDPVVIFGGTDGTDETSTAGFQQATAYVSDVSSGRIVSLALTNGGFGYRASPNTTITVVADPSNPEGVEGNITVGTVNTAAGITLSLANDAISAYASKALNLAGGWGLPACTTANITTTEALSTLFRFENITFYPISSLVIQNGGHDYTIAPTLTFNTVFGTANTKIESLGMIANVAILASGTGYTTGQTVVFSGSGIGATATITASGGAVTGVNFASQAARGFGYTNGDTTATISGGGSGAVLRVYGFNEGAAVNLSVDDIGKINHIAVSNPGFGYSSVPLASLKIMDVFVSSLGSSIQSDQVLTAYQGSSLATATFTANVDAYFTSTNANNTIRLYDYTGAFSTLSTLKIAGTATTFTVTGNQIYGNGLARANVNFVDGTVTYPGYFLNTDGFLSADKKIQDGTKYHNYSYVIESKKQLKDFKQTLMNIVHPAGMRMIAHTKIADNYDATKDVNMKPFKVKANTGNINAGPMLFTTYYNGANANIDLGTANTSNITSNAVATTNFTTLAIQAGDRLILNYANTNRAITLTVASVTSSTRLNTTQPVVLPGVGLITLNSASVYATCTENVAGKIAVDDYLRIFNKFDYNETGTDAHVIVRRVAAAPTNNIIQLASAPPISNSGLGYWIDPDFRNTPFKVERNV